MLIINRYKCPISGKTSICAHVMKGNKVVQSYKKCDESMLPVIVKGHKCYGIWDVSHAHKLEKVNIVRVNN